MDKLHSDAASGFEALLFDRFVLMISNGCIFTPAYRFRRSSP
jgi:hypothetical protein